MGTYAPQTTVLNGNYTTEKKALIPNITDTFVPISKNKSAVRSQHGTNIAYFLQKRAGGNLFNLNILPMNLKQGRNLGELPGFSAYSAPKKSDKTRINDVLILLITPLNCVPSLKTYALWASILSEAYYSAHGSFTMGITSAVRQLADHLDKNYPGSSIPSLAVNLLVLRGRSMLICHAGNVNTTLISANSAENFCDESSTPIDSNADGLRFFQVEIHSGDLILLCPSAPTGWTNNAILDATSESPLNVIRYLLDQSKGNLQAGVIQLKSGSGEILFRTKPPIKTSVQLGYESNITLTFEPDPAVIFTKPHSNINENNKDENIPLFLKKQPCDFIPDFEALKKGTLKKCEVEESSFRKSVEESAVPIEEQSILDPENATPETTDINLLRQPITELTEKKVPKPPRRRRSPHVFKLKNFKFSVLQLKKGGKISAALICSLLIPLMVVSIVFNFYANRGKNSVFLENLNMAVQTAQTALNQTETLLQLVAWEKTIEYLDEAEKYGAAPASVDLRVQAYKMLDSLAGAVPISYHYILSRPPSTSVRFTKLEASSQFVYALDQTKGEVFRYLSGNAGLVRDETFRCASGIYSAETEPTTKIEVGPVIDFVLLPVGGGHYASVAGVDKNGNILYCSAEKENKAISLQPPSASGWGIDGLSFNNKTLYILDRQSNAIWKYGYNNSSGFLTVPSKYFGSGAPKIDDVQQFAVYDNYSYFLKTDGSLVFCDYTGYTPSCAKIDEVKDASTDAMISLKGRKFNQITVNAAPDISLYLIDQQNQSVLNLTLKANLVRIFAPERTNDPLLKKNVTAFTISNTRTILWASGNEIYSGLIH